MASTELGHQEKRVYLSQDGVLVVPSSARLQVEPGGIFCEFGNAMTAAVGNLTTNLNGVLPNRGVSIIKTTAATVHGIKAITKYTVGVTKTIIVDTSAVIKIRASTGLATYAIKFGSSICSIAQTSDFGKQRHLTVKRGSCINLFAESTNRWRLMGIDSSAENNFTFSSST